MTEEYSETERVIKCSKLIASIQLDLGEVLVLFPHKTLQPGYRPKNNKLKARFSGQKLISHAL